MKSLYMTMDTILSYFYSVNNIFHHAKFIFAAKVGLKILHFGVVQNHNTKLRISGGAVGHPLYVFGAG